MSDSARLVSSILLVGYGKMGREIEQVARERSHSVAGIVDPYADGQQNLLSDVDMTGVDVVIDFSTADAFLHNYKFYAEQGRRERGMAVVVGTTGWYHEFERVKAAFNANGVGCVYGSNFSVGAQMFLRLVGYAAKLLAPLEEYDMMLTEAHHRQKIDSPSGTAKSAAQAVLRNNPRKKKQVFGSLQGAIKEKELHVVSLRGGSIPGEHTLTIDSPFDTITVSHSARTRHGFALGAVLAAEWLAAEHRGFSGTGRRRSAGQPIGVHNIEDIIEEVASARASLVNPAAPNAPAGDAGEEQK